MGKLKQLKSCFLTTILHILLLMKRPNPRIVLTTCDQLVTKHQEVPPEVAEHPVGRQVGKQMLCRRNLVYPAPPRRK